MTNLLQQDIINSVSFIYDRVKEKLRDDFESKTNNNLNFCIDPTYFCPCPCVYEYGNPKFFEYIIIHKYLKYGPADFQTGNNIEYRYICGTNNNN